MVRILVSGASGQLGAYLLRSLGAEELQVIAWSGTFSGVRQGISITPVDLGDAAAVARAFRSARPDVVIHAGAMARVADCHRDPDRARRINVEGTVVLARLAAEVGARLVHVSTDLVFDGESAPYREADPPRPLSVYGRTKAEAETVALSAPRAVVARVGLLFGPSLTERPSFFDEQRSALLGGKTVALFADEWRTPLDLPTAAAALVQLARSDVAGTVHLGGPERMSRLEMGERLAAVIGADSSRLIASRRADVPAPEPRPRDTSLDSSRWRALFPVLPWPTYEDAVRRSLQ